MSTLNYLRSFRILNIAVFDLVTALVGMIILFLFIHNKFFSKLPRDNFIIMAVILTIPVGIFFHVIFGVNTTLNRYLGVSY